MHDINWDVFTREEKDNIMRVVKLQAPHMLTSVIENSNMTLEKEKELQKIHNHIAPEFSVDFSSKLKEWEDQRVRQGKKPHPETPEEEAELQSLIDEARSKQKQKAANIEPTPSPKELEKTPVEAPTRGRPKKVVVEEVKAEETKEEVKEEVKEDKILAE